jgi:hypothetical protein
LRTNAAVSPSILFQNASGTLTQTTPIPKPISMRERLRILHRKQRQTHQMRQFLIHRGTNNYERYSNGNQSSKTSSVSAG